MITDRSIICFGGEDWWYHHPHSKKHLMRRFARAGSKVIFVNSISMGLPSLAHKDLMPKIGRKLKSYAKYARTTDEGITVSARTTELVPWEMIESVIDELIASGETDREGMRSAGVSGTFRSAFIFALLAEAEVVTVDQTQGRTTLRLRRV